jgi:hypothetical protein
VVVPPVNSESVEYPRSIWHGAVNLGASHGFTPWSTAIPTLDSRMSVFPYASRCPAKEQVVLSFNWESAL